MNILKQIQKLGDMKNFSWKEMFSDNTGKTSGSSFVGVITTLAGVGVFIFTSIVKSTELVNQAVTVIGIGAALLGVNKVMNGKPIVQDVPAPEEPSNQKDE